MGESEIVRQLREIAARLSDDPGLQRNLVHEMFVHLVRLRTASAVHATDWYLKDCERHAAEYLERHPSCSSASHTNSERGFSNDMITADIANRIRSRLSNRQQQSLNLLLDGYGVRETARQLGVTHPAVIKHRKKIARIAHELLQQSDANGVMAITHYGLRDGTEADSS